MVACNHHIQRINDVAVAVGVPGSLDALKHPLYGPVLIREWGKSNLPRPRLGNRHEKKQQTTLRYTFANVLLAHQSLEVSQGLGGPGEHAQRYTCTAVDFNRRRGEVALEAASVDLSVRLWQSRKEDSVGTPYAPVQVSSRAAQDFSQVSTSRGHHSLVWGQENLLGNLAGDRCSCDR